MSRRDADLAAFERLAADLDAELQYSDTLDWSNASLEQSVEDLREKLRAQDEGSPADEDAQEWKTRYESQVALNSQLRVQQEALTEQQASVRANIKEGQRGDVYKIDTMYPEYEKYTETELIKLLKQLERDKQELISSLKNLQYQTDRESKEFHRFDELRRTYRADIGITNRDLEHLRSVRRLVDKDGPVSPITSPGSLRWNNKDGIAAGQRVLDARRGPISRTVGVHCLPRVEDLPRDRDRPPLSPESSAAGEGRAAAQSSPRPDQRSGQARNLPKLANSRPEGKGKKEPSGQQKSKDVNTHRDKENKKK